MPNKVLGIALFLFLSVAVTSIVVRAQDDATDGQDTPVAGVKSHGVIHNIAQDRQIDRVGGIYEPEGLDKYMNRKFEALSAKIDELESKIDQLSAELKKTPEAKPAPERPAGLIG